MRLWPFAKTTTAAAGDNPATVVDTAVVSAATSARSYDSPLGFAGNQALKSAVDLAVYDILVRAFPFLDRGLRSLSRMIVPFDVTCDNKATGDELRSWLRTVAVEDVFKGITPFSRPYVRQALQYGRSGGEVVLSQTKRDIAGLCVIDAKRIRLIRTDTGLQVGEVNTLGQTTPYPDQTTIVYSALNKEGDDPNGVSLLRAIPFVSDICLRMEVAMRQMWTRHGAPSFLLKHTVGSDIPVSSEEMASRRTTIEAAWNESQKARRNNEGIIDFTMCLQGEFDISAIGSDIAELSFQEPYRSMTEQIVASVELAPFMLGLQWSTTERLSQQQADTIIGAVKDYRSELEPDFLRILHWVQRVRGLRGTVGVKWEDVNLQDRVQEAQAENTEAQAKKTRLDVALTAWANGFIDQEGAARDAGYDEPIAQALDAPVLPGQGAAAGTVAAETALWGAYPTGGND